MKILTSHSSGSNCEVDSDEFVETFNLNNSITSDTNLNENNVNNILGDFIEIKRRSYYRLY